MSRSIDTGEYIEAQLMMSQTQQNEFYETNQITLQNSENKVTGHRCRDRHLILTGSENNSNELNLKVFYPDPSGKSPCD